MVYLDIDFIFNIIVNSVVFFSFFFINYELHFRCSLIYYL